MIRACPRCAGKPMFRIRSVADAVPVGEGVVEWKDRAVAFHQPPRRSFLHRPDAEALGRFELLVCRGCGHTRWFAFDLARIDQPRERVPCAACAEPTPHLEVPALDRTAYGFEQQRITAGRLGQEGFLFIRICEPCGTVAWRGREYEHLENGVWKRFRVVDDRARPCLACGATDAIVDPKKLDDGHALPVAIRRRKLGAWFFETTVFSETGRFEVRVCRPCGAVEWYARGLEKLKDDPASGVEALGDPAPRTPGGPYR